MEFVDEDDMSDLRKNIQSRAAAMQIEYHKQYSQYDDQPPPQSQRVRKENTFYEERPGGGASRRGRRSDASKPEQSRPKTGQRGYGVDSSYYLDDPNEDY
jgi:hypothetical protein